MVNGRCVICNQRLGHDFILHHQTPLPQEVSDRLRAEFRGGMTPSEAESLDADTQRTRRSRRVTDDD